jgi:UDP-N-acetylglucosamine 2-epimerase (non-hydrolysing)
MAALDRNIDHAIVHTGQNYDYELNQIFFDDLEIRKPDYFLDAAGKNAAETAGLVISRADEALEKIKPDAVLILGDTNSCLAAYAAKRRKIPIFHMEAGNRCFDQRVRRRSIVRLSTTSVTSICRIAQLAASTLFGKGCPRIALLKR